jgi:hypothetical protein
MLVAVAMAVSAPLGQVSTGPAKPAAAISGTLELPVLLQQKVIAGHTLVGARVKAKLTLATLVRGVVIPENAVISGEVVESSARSVSEPSRLAVRMDTAQWKTTSLTLDPRLYLTAWYYPTAITLNQNSPSGIPDATSDQRIRGAGGLYPGQRAPISPPFSGADKGSEPASEPADNSKHRLLMKNIDSSVNSEGVIVLTSKNATIKLDRSTTYVLAGSDLHGAK